MVACHPSDDTLLPVIDVSVQKATKIEKNFLFFV